MKQVLSVTVRAALLEELRGLVRQAMAATAQDSGAEPSASVAERALDDVSAAIYDLVRHRCADAVANATSAKPVVRLIGHIGAHGEIVAVSSFTGEALVPGEQVYVLASGRVADDATPATPYPNPTAPGDDLHAAIMTIPCDTTGYSDQDGGITPKRAYMHGHRDARHAAAKLSLSADAELERVNTLLLDTEMSLKDAQDERDDALADAESWRQQADARIDDALRFANERDELRAALEIAEAALADIGDADREPGDDVAWCEARAAEALPAARAALALKSDQLDSAMCACGVKQASDCVEQWGPDCDLGNNPAHVRRAPDAAEALLTTALAEGKQPAPACKGDPGECEFHGGCLYDCGATAGRATDASDRLCQPVELAPLQISAIIVALRFHMDVLEKQLQGEPEGGEHEDYMIAQSALKALTRAGEAVKAARLQSSRCGLIAPPTDAS
jgi:hypothetical protein